MQCVRERGLFVTAVVLVILANDAARARVKRGSSQGCSRDWSVNPRPGPRSAASGCR
jgi:hypothetical protein